MSTSQKESLVSQYFGFKKKSKSKSHNNSSSSTSSSQATSPSIVKANVHRTKPLVWSGKSQDDLKIWKLACPLYSTPILSSISGPNGGLTRARALSKPLTLRHEDQFMFIDDEVDESNYNCYDGNKNKLDQRQSKSNCSTSSSSNNRSNNNNFYHPTLPSINGNCSSTSREYNNVNSGHTNWTLPRPESPSDPPALPPKRSAMNRLPLTDTASRRQTPPPSFASASSPSSSSSSPLPSSSFSLLRKPLPLPPELLVNSGDSIAGSSCWTNCVPEFAFGISESLYERHPITGARAAEPIADCYALSVRPNSAIIAIADGVNWGTGSALAATCAIRGAMEYLNKAIYHGIDGASGVTTTREIAISLLRSMTVAHTLILSDENASQTTLTVGVTAQLADSNKWVLVTCNVGDSFGYIFSPQHGVREVTEASHDIHVNRNMSDTCGALGPVIGNEPVLDNLTIAMTLVDEGDVIIFASDGISDNFDPVVGDRALAQGSKQAKRYSERLLLQECTSTTAKTTSTTAETTSKKKDSQSFSFDSSAKKNKNSAKSQPYPEVFNGTGHSKDTSTPCTPSKLLLPHSNSNKSHNQQHDTSSHQRWSEASSSRSESCTSTSKAGNNKCTSSNNAATSTTSPSTSTKPLASVPIVTAKERHEMTLARMEQVIYASRNGQGQVTAQGIAEALFQYVKGLTAEKRSAIERKELYNLTGDGLDDFTLVCQKERRKKAGRSFHNAPGKLDHASIVTFKVAVRTNTDGTKDESTIW